MSPNDELLKDGTLTLDTFGQQELEDASEFIFQEKDDSRVLSPSEADDFASLWNETH